jgi:hypothetical protein
MVASCCVTLSEVREVPAADHLVKAYFNHFRWGCKCQQSGCAAVLGATARIACGVPAADA